MVSCVCARGLLTGAERCYSSFSKAKQTLKQQWIRPVKWQEGKKVEITASPASDWCGKMKPDANAVFLGICWLMLAAAAHISGLWAMLPSAVHFWLPVLCYGLHSHQNCVTNWEQQLVWFIKSQLMSCFLPGHIGGHIEPSHGPALARLWSDVILIFQIILSGFNECFFASIKSICAPWVVPGLVWYYLTKHPGWRKPAWLTFI